MNSFAIAPVHTPDDLAAIVALFEKYAQSLGIDLTFQDFATELHSLPGKYAASHGGILLLARRNSSNEPLGCVALRCLHAEKGYCEMKRLYVDPASRGLGLGQALAEAIIQQARKMNYKSVRLDTLPNMTAARKLYQGLGFVEINAYYDTPIEGTIFLELQLPSSS